MSLRLLEGEGQREGTGGGSLCIFLVLPLGTSGLLLSFVSRVTKLKIYGWKGGVEIGWTVDFPYRVGPLLAREPSKKYFLSHATLVAKLPPAGFSDQTHQINLLVLAVVVCPQSAHLPGGNMPRPQIT
jgi:hypothetical protein